MNNLHVYSVFRLERRRRLRSGGIPEGTGPCSEADRESFHVMSKSGYSQTSTEEMMTLRTKIMYQRMIGSISLSSLGEHDCFKTASEKRIFYVQVNRSLLCNLGS